MTVPTPTTTNSDLTEPVDRTHRESLRAQRDLNSVFQALKAKAVRWVPRPVPVDWPKRR